METKIPPRAVPSSFVISLVEIALPTVVMTPKADLRVRGARGVAVPFEDYTGVFHVDVILSEGAGTGSKS